MAIYGVANAATTSTPIAVNNKTSKFNAVLSETGASASDTSTNELADTIRRQRALLDAQNTKTTTKGNNSQSGITTSNACDKALRDCMTEKCGKNFTKCAKDSTTIWGNKMDSCRRNTKCTGHEYSLIAPEILADRDAYIKLSYYQSVVDCGEMYNSCIFDICGKTMNGCLSKSAGDSAVAKCKSIADQCKEYDNGLAARAMGVFGDLRTIATKNVARDEQELYKLRDLMQTQCARLGAMFDERTLDCVYTVNFFAGEDNTLMASKKLYAGDTFKCEPEWFGIDITTFKENAYRLTRSQKSASMAALGAGVGTAAGLWTSGAVTRAMNTQDAESAAKEQCVANGGEWVSAGFNKGKECDMTNAEENLAKKKQQKEGTETPQETDLLDTNDRNQDWNQLPSEIDCQYYENADNCNNDTRCEYQDNVGCVAKSGLTESKDDKDTESKNNTSTVNINFRATNRDKKVTLKAELTCEYKDSGGRTQTSNASSNLLTGRVRLNRVPTDAICTITTTEQCKQKTPKSAKDLAQLSDAPFECPDIDNCSGAGGTWKNNSCSCGKDQKFEDNKCVPKNLVEKCETFCDKQAKQLTQDKLNRPFQISKITNEKCFAQCRQSFDKQCQSLLPQGVANPQAHLTAEAWSYTCGVKSVSSEQRKNRI